VAVGVGLLTHLSDGLSTVLNFVAVNNGVTDGPGDVPLVGVGDVLALPHRRGDTVGVADLLDGLGDAGVVESGGDGAVKSLSVGLPLADVPVKDTRSTSKGLSINRDTLLNLDSVGGGNALSDVALLRGLGAGGGDDLLATLSDGGVLKHIHNSLADLPGSLNSPWDTLLHRSADTSGCAHVSSNSPADDTNSATDGNAATNAGAWKEQAGCFRLSLRSGSGEASAKKNNCEFHL